MRETRVKQDYFHMMLHMLRILSTVKNTTENLGQLIRVQEAKFGLRTISEFGASAHHQSVGPGICSSEGGQSGIIKQLQLAVLIIETIRH